MSTGERSASVLVFVGRRSLVVGATVLLTVGRLCLAPSLQAQQTDPAGEPGPRRAALSGGLGNHYGGVGAQVEVYALHERASILGAAGYASGPIRDGAFTFAAAVRGYLPGQRHRVYGSLGVAPLESEQEWTFASVDVGITQGTLSDPRFHYGPTVSAGYQYTARRGFTAQLGGGVGFHADGVFLVLDAGAGYTFGR